MVGIKEDTKISSSMIYFNKIFSKEVMKMFDIEKERKKMGRPRKFNNPDELFEAGIEYIQECIDNGEPLTVTGLCLALDANKDTILDYERGKYNEEGKDFSAPIKKLKMMVENGYEKLLHTGKPTGGIFALKNFGWKDEQHMIQTVNAEPTEEDVEKIKERYGLK